MHTQVKSLTLADYDAILDHATPVGSNEDTIQLAAKAQQCKPSDLETNLSVDESENIVSLEGTIFDKKVVNTTDDGGGQEVHLPVEENSIRRQNSRISHEKKRHKCKCGSTTHQRITSRGRFSDSFY